MNLSKHESKVVKQALRIIARHMQKHGDALTTPAAVRTYLRIRLAGELREVFVVIFLDSQHRVIAAEDMFYGTLGQTSVYPREVVRACIHHNAGAVIFAHNHPSGVAQPSQSDELLTRTLREALVYIDVRVLDHFIVGEDAILSFSERGLL